MKKKVYTTSTTTPTHIPFECPVCSGYGTVGGLKTPIKECHGCKGTGWISVKQDLDEIITTIWNSINKFYILTPKNNNEKIK